MCLFMSTLNFLNFTALPMTIIYANFLLYCHPFWHYVLPFILIKLLYQSYCVLKLKKN